MQSIEEKVDLLVDPPRQQKTKRTKRALRLIGAGGSLTGIAKGLIVMTAVGALISTMVGTYLVSQSDNIALEGRLAYDLYVDGVPCGQEDLVMPPDEFTDDKLTWEEGEEIFTHTFYSPPNNGNFSITADIESWQPWLYPVPQENHEFYGYEFKLLDENDQEITEFTVMSGDPAREIKFVHTLDVHFAATDNPLPYNLVLSVEEWKTPPQANDYTHHQGPTQDIVIPISTLATDPDGVPAPLTFTDVHHISGNSGAIGVIILPGSTTLNVHTSGEWMNGYTSVWSYTVTDGESTDTGLLTIVNP